jgi:hypothetical protein
LPSLCKGGDARKKEPKDLSNAIGRWLKRKMWKLRFEMLEERKQEKKKYNSYLAKIVRSKV